jgi:O-acetyl-ADP-ribose deacetylase (regulator of RNase III)
MITYLKGDATVPQAKGPKLIAHVVNDLGGWGKGFVLAISRRWPEPEASYRRWHAERAKNDFALGVIQVVQVMPDIYVVNMVAQCGIRTGSKGPSIRYEALEDCLRKLHTVANEHRASVHMPRIGCGLAGGKWDKVEPLIQAALDDVAVFVYDYDA